LHKIKTNLFFFILEMIIPSTKIELQLCKFVYACDGEIERIKIQRKEQRQTERRESK